jgi:predicted RNA-binding Zn-ribbon protein involved in translation (DUF1610 family)
MRHYITKYYSSPYVCEDCNFMTKVRCVTIVTIFNFIARLSSARVPSQDMSAGLSSFSAAAVESQPCPRCPQASMFRQVREWNATFSVPQRHCPS